MARTDNTALRWIALALLGATSGILSASSPRLVGSFWIFWIGGVFGVALATYFMFYKGLRNPVKIVSLIAASAVSYLCAFYGSMFVLRLPSPLVYGYGRDRSEFSIIAAGGLIGGLLIVASVLKLLRFDKRNILGPALVGSLLSGFLGVVGWRLGASLGKVLWTALPDGPLPGVDSFHSYSLYPIWQTAMALFIGFVAERQTEAEAATLQPARAKPGISLGKPLVAGRKVFLTTLVILGCVLAARVTPIRLGLKHRQSAAAEKASEVPSMVGLPVIEMMPLGQALILQDIDGLQPVKPGRMPMMESHERGFLSPRSFGYGVMYCVGDEVSYSHSVSVAVQQYPSAEWAAYFAKYPHNRVNLFNDPKNPALVSKFQNKVWSNLLEINLPGNSLYYVWPSANNVVTIDYNPPNANDDEFLRVYLEKYPSSIK